MGNKEGNVWASPASSMVGRTGLLIQVPVGIKALLNDKFLHERDDNGRLVVVGMAAAVMAIPLAPLLFAIDKVVHTIDARTALLVSDKKHPEIKGGKRYRNAREN